jgi:hypothetical protein
LLFCLLTPSHLACVFENQPTQISAMLLLGADKGGWFMGDLVIAPDYYTPYATLQPEVNSLNITKSFVKKSLYPLMQSGNNSPVFHGKP